MMKPERIPLQTVLESTEKLMWVIRSIQAGAVFVYPTETIYGIGGRADLQSVKDRVYKAKNRPPLNPVILIASQCSFFASSGLTIPTAAEELMKRFWPGLLTLVLPTTQNPEGTAVRVSDHPFIRAVFSGLATPLISTSANLSGQKYSPDPDKIYETFCSSVDFMIDAGSLPPSPPSTVVKISNDNKISLIREGAVSSAEIFHTVS